MNANFLFHTICHDIALPVESEQELIRIEKKIQLQSRLGNGIDINEAQEMIALIKNHGSALQYIQNEKNIVRFLCQQTFNVSEIQHLQSEEEANEISAVIDHYFYDSFISAIDFYFLNKKYGELYSLKYYVELLPHRLRHYIENKQVEKLDFALHLMETNADVKRLEREIDYLTTRGYIDTLNIFPSYEIDDSINDLVNLTANHVNTDKHPDRKKFYLQFFMALGKYQSTNEHLEEIIGSNYLYAEQNIYKIKSWFGRTTMRWGFFIVFIVLKLLFTAKSCSSFFEDDYESEYEVSNPSYQIPSTLCENSAFIDDLNTLSYYVRTNERNIPFEKEMNQKVNAVIQTKKSLDHPEQNISILFENQTEKDAYLFSERSCEHTDFIFKIKPHQKEYVHLFKNESFKILLNGASNKNTFELFGFNRMEAMYLAKEFYAYEQLKSPAFFTIRYDKTYGYLEEKSDNIANH